VQSLTAKAGRRSIAMGQVFYEILKLGSSGIQQNADTPASDYWVLESNVLFSIELENFCLFMRMLDLPEI
tara:strand:+ start:50 stop:259 length:210 start_codon:yes stop_codon:yes gene_type:complete